LAGALLELGDHVQATQSAEELARLDPGNSLNATKAALLLADCAEAARQDKGLSEPQRLAAAAAYLRTAKTILHTMAQLSRDRPVFLSGLAWFLGSCSKGSLRDPAFALELAESAVAKESANPNFWSSLGLAHYRLGHWEEAIRAIEKEFTIAGRADTEDLLILAMAHHRRGDRQRAIEEYGQAIAALQKASIPPTLQDELTRFRIEATNVLGLADLPTEVFARP
jgi:tetratricopeptide (TPR) repeat protein